MGVEQLRGGVEQGAAGGDPGGVAQAVDATELLHRAGHRPGGLLRVGHIRLHKPHVAAECFEFGGEPLAGVQPAPGDHHLGTLARRGAGGRPADTLRAAVDQHDFSVE